MACHSKHPNAGVNEAIMGSTRVLHSNILKEDRKILIYTPMDSTASASKKIPVVYLLDAEDLFNSTVEMVKQYSKQGIIPPLMVVGITNTDRIRDLTPTHDPEPSKSATLPVNDKQFRSSGGAEAFTKFLEQELIPFIQSNYLVSTKVLAGHSLGGLFTVSTLLTHSNIFNAYIAIDPSIWWDSEWCIRLAKTAGKHHNFNGISFYYANSNTARSISETTHLDSNKDPFRREQEFGKCFENYGPKELVFRWESFSFDNHGTIPLVGLYEGLRFIFKDSSDIQGSHFGSSLDIYKSLLDTLIQNKDTVAALRLCQESVQLYPSETELQEIYSRLNGTQSKYFP